MTIKEFAKMQGITTQAVYQRIKAAGLKLSDIKKNNSAELTAEGLEACKRLYSTDNEDVKRENKAIKEQLKALEAENADLKKTLEAKEQEINRLTAEKDRWASMAEQAQQTAQQAQALQMASLKALPAPRRSLWARLMGKGKE